jgi:hypothetical protein
MNVFLSREGRTPKANICLLTRAVQIVVCRDRFLANHPKKSGENVNDAPDIAPLQESMS